MAEMREPRFIRTIPALLVTALLCAAAGARTIYVDDDAPAFGDGSSWESAYRYLQDALAEAEAADEPVEIRVGQGLYRPDRSAAHPEGTGDREATFFLVDRTTIKGGYAGLATTDPNERDIEAYATVLSGDLGDNDAEHANPLNAREDPTRADNCYHVISYTAYEFEARLTAEIDGCVVSGGYAFERKASAILPTISENQGGGLFADFRKGLPVKVTLRRCRFLNNYAEEKGGGFFCEQAEGWQLIDCIFTGNGTHVDGGALYAYFSSLELVRCRFEGNRSDQYGGAMYFSAIGEVTLHCCTLVGNVARGTGGALVIHSGITRCVGCLLKDNVAVMWRGGAVDMTSASFEARECQFIGNKAGIEGGAINNRSGRLVRLASCLLSGNAAKEGGGAFGTAHGDEVKLVNCTASGNQAPQGRFLRDATAAWDESRIRIANCIIMDGDNEVWNARSTINIEYSNLSDGHTAIHDPEGQVVWGTGNIDADPLFADPGYWDPNVTPDDPNDDFWVDGDYHLKSQAGRWDAAMGDWAVDETTSPCTDGGDLKSPVGYEPFPNGGRINMGAYGGTAEASKSYFNGPVCETIIAGDINGDCRVDFKDLQILSLHWLDSGDQAQE